MNTGFCEPLGEHITGLTSGGIDVPNMTTFPGVR
jgi:hypothetical protein